MDTPKTHNIIAFRNGSKMYVNTDDNGKDVRGISGIPLESIRDMRTAMKDFEEREARPKQEWTKR